MATNITFLCHRRNPTTGVTGEQSAVISVNDQTVNPMDPPLNIVSISAASPGVVTFDRAHRLTTGDKVVIAGSACAPTVDGERTVTVVAATTASMGVNTTGAQAVPGGQASRTATTVTADNARRIPIDATTANANGILPGIYENVGAATFRLQGAV